MFYFLILFYQVPKILPGYIDESKEVDDNNHPTPQVVLKWVKTEQVTELQW